MILYVERVRYFGKLALQIRAVVLATNVRSGTTAEHQKWEYSWGWDLRCSFCLTRHTRLEDIGSTIDRVALHSDRRRQRHAYLARLTALTPSSSCADRTIYDYFMKLATKPEAAQQATMPDHRKVSTYRAADSTTNRDVG